MTQPLSYIEINPQTLPQATIIWLHGLGADGNDFVPIAEELHLSHLPLRFVFPHAPMMPVTINNGYVMRAWYDIRSLSIDQHADQSGIETSVQQCRHLIAAEQQRGIPSKNIILAGFSQGAVIALSTGLTHPDPLGGIIALSGYLPFGKEIMEKSTSANQTTSIFLAHGTEDTIVPFPLGEITHQFLQKNNYAVEWHAYRMPHSVCAEEIRDIAGYLSKQVVQTDRV